MRPFITLVVFITMALSGTGCFNNEVRKDAGSAYYFLVDGRFYPSINDTINVWDTIYFDSTFPTTLTDTISGSEIDYSQSLGIQGSIEIDRDFTSGSDASTTFYFKPYSIDGGLDEIRAPGTAKQLIGLTFQEDHQTYKLKMGLIAQSPGVFSFYVNGFVSNGTGGKMPSNLALFEPLLKNTDQHFDFYETYFGKVNDRERSHFFCVVVK